MLEYGLKRRRDLISMKREVLYVNPYVGYTPAQVLRASTRSSSCQLFALCYIGMVRNAVYVAYCRVDVD